MKTRRRVDDDRIDVLRFEQRGVEDRAARHVDVAVKRQSRRRVRDPRRASGRLPSLSRVASLVGEQFRSFGSTR